MERLQAAIEAIQSGNRLSEDEKQRKIDWLEEGKLLARTVTTEAIKALILGAV
jgi:hypothetical protein